MAKIIATTFGAVLVLFGLAGFFSPLLCGALCTPVHNFLNLVLGGLVILLAQKAGASMLLWGTGAAGATYLMGGLVGLTAGRPGQPVFAGAPPDDYLLVVIPRVLEFNRADHILHLLFGVALITACIASVAETPLRLRK